jgi:diguanylate cyclase (GGDEF)-like protein/PAS domain S-box-containing protein
MPDPTDHFNLPSLDSAFHEKLIESMHDGVYFVDRERKILYWNKGAELLTGYSAEEVVGRFCFDNILAHVAGSGCALCLKGCPLGETIADGKRRGNDIFLRHKLGHRIPVSVRISPISDANGSIIGAVEVFSDATEKRHIERRVGELENLVYLDDLTGVPNRRYIQLKVAQAIQEVQQFDRQIGLMVVDVDHFKQVNDEHGHTIGDEALKAVCKTLSHSLRSGDVLGRWGGEELLIIAEDITSGNLHAFAERCRMLTAATDIPVPGGHLQVTVSMGATLINREDTDQSAIGRADELMYQSKIQGRNRVTLG